MQPAPGTRYHSRGKVAEDRKLTSAICAEPKWLWAGVQHGQVESSWHRRASRALFVTVNNNCFLTIRVGQECTASQSLTFSPNLSNLRERSCVKTDCKIFNCVCRLQKTIGILQEPLTLSDMEGTQSLLAVFINRIKVYIYTKIVSFSTGRFVIAPLFPCLYCCKQNIDFLSTFH